MHDETRFLRGGVGHADEMEDGQALGVGAGDAVEGAELADAVGGADGGDATDAGVAVGGVGGVEFVAAADPAHVVAVADGVADGKGEVARHAEDVGDADFAQAREDVVNDGHRGRRT